MNTATTHATYTKLRDGTWGIRAPYEAHDPITAGRCIVVVTKAGARKTETIRAVIWSGNGVAICSIVQTARPVARAGSWRSAGGAWNGCSMGCREGNPNPRCRSCCFDEFDN